MKCKSGRLLWWAMFLQPYQFTISYKPGKNHGNADGLSRRQYDSTAPQNAKEKTVGNYQGTEERNPVSVLDNFVQAEKAYLNLQPLSALQDVLAVSVDGIRKAQLEDPRLLPYIQFLEEDILPEDKKLASRIRDEQLTYQMTDGILYHLHSPRGKGSKATREVKQLCIPQSMRDDVLRSYHDSLGHQGQDRTQRAITLKYFWPRMQSDIEFYIKSCESCQMAKAQSHKKKAPLKPLPITDVFGRLHMDILGPLKKTAEGYSYILLVVCPFSKWCEAFPLKSIEAKQVARVLYSEIICRYGAPREILTDQGSNFTSKIIAEVCKTFQITKLQTSSYHPQTNAACERMNSLIWQTLRAHGKEDQSDWVEILPSVLHAYRTTPATESTGYSPHYMLFLREPVQPIDTELLPATPVDKPVKEYIEHLREKAKITHQIARDNITAAQEKYTKQHDKRSAPPTFQQHDKVWLYCSKSKPGLTTKLCKKWLGPYYICIQYGNNTYKLRRASDHKLVRSVIHADRLKSFVDKADRPTNLPDMEEDQQGQEHNPEEIEEIEPQENNDGQPQTQPGPSHSAQDENQHSPEHIVQDSQGQSSQQQTQGVQPTTKFKRENIIRIARCSRYQGKRIYYVFFSDGTCNWYREEQLPDNMIRHYHAHKTYAGHTRKRPQKTQDNEQNIDKQAAIQLVKLVCNPVSPSRL